MVAQPQISNDLYSRTIANLFRLPNLKMKVKAYTDGACSGNPGPGGWGVYLIAENNLGKVVKEEEDTSKDILDDYRDYASWYKNNFKNENTWHNQVSSFRDTKYIKNVLSYILLGTILIGICVGIKVAAFPNESSMGKKTNYTSLYLILIVFLFLIINQMI